MFGTVILIKSQLGGHRPYCGYLAKWSYCQLLSKYLCYINRLVLFSSLAREASSRSWQQSVEGCITGQSAESKRLSAQP